MKRVVKNLLCFFVASTIAIALALTVSAKKNITVTLDGKVLTFDQNPIIEEGRTLVPLRGIFEAMGASVSWDDNTRCVTAKKDDIEIKLIIGEKFIYKNGSAIELDVPAQIVNSRTLVPARSVSESFGARVCWDASNKNVIISTDSVLNNALSKFNDTKEIVVFAKGKILYDTFESDMQIKAGVDFNNQKAFVVCDFKSEFANTSTQIVFGDGKVYAYDGSEVKTQEGIVCDFDSLKTPFFVLESETEKEKIYFAKIALGDEVAQLKIALDKESGTFVKATVLKDTVKQFIGDDLAEVTNDFELTAEFNSGETIEMWEKYSK